jgi:hypothetical protein
MMPPTSRAELHEPTLHQAFKPVAHPEGLEAGSD